MVWTTNWIRGVTELAADFAVGLVSCIGIRGRCRTRYLICDMYRHSTAQMRQSRRNEKKDTAINSEQTRKWKREHIPFWYSGAHVHLKHKIRTKITWYELISRTNSVRASAYVTSLEIIAKALSESAIRSKSLDSISCWLTASVDQPTSAGTLHPW